MVLIRDILLLAALMLLPVTVWSGTIPTLGIEEPVYDFGTVFQGDTVSHTFIVRNSGKETLHIERLKTSCGCTAALLSARTIPPGGQGTIRATFDSSRFRGGVEKHIFLYPDLPGTQPVKLTLKGSVEPVVEAQPSQLDFGRVKVGEEAEEKLVLVNAGRKKLEIRNIRTSNTALNAGTEAEVLSPGVETEFKVTAKPAEATRHLNGYVLIRTDQASLGELRIPVRGSVDR